jgi:hypothetical protein
VLLFSEDFLSLGRMARYTLRSEQQSLADGGVGSKAGVQLRAQEWFKVAFLLSHFRECLSASSSKDPP